jgi:cytochrome c6
MKSVKRLAVLALIATFALTGSAFAAEKTTQDLYTAKCAKCHGNDGVATAVGKKLGVKDFSDPEVLKATDKDMMDVTANGKGKMPAYGKSLKAEEIKGLVDYIRSMTKKGK